ncbi:MAG: hypothetical protein U0Q18_13050 [Bryobacteraceae bacterium]
MIEPPKASQWFASPWNLAPEPDSVSALPPRIRFHDVTLRDGEQQAGIVFSRQERIAVARALAECGVDRIEAGMPAESAADRDLVETLASLGLSEKLFPFAGCSPESARIARECGARGIVFKVTTSRHLLAHGYRQTLEQAIGDAIDATLAAREAGLYTVLFTIDATRTPLREYLDTVECIVSRGHCDSIAIADSYGAAAPNGIASAVRALRQRLKLPVEIHCHNDFGLAVGNTLAGLMAGAEVAHVTVCGIGERAGNASLEETSMALRCLYGAQAGIDTERLYGLSRMVREFGGFALPPNRPIVGQDLYRIESGVVAMLHRRCRESHPLEYLPFLPEVAGGPPIEIVYGKGSGRANIEEFLEKRGISATDDEKRELVNGVREMALCRKRLLDADEVQAIWERVRAVAIGN